MNRFTLYAISFVANGAVLVFEIVGARFLAPYLGTSTEVWAGLIAVILGGLALGYWLGGFVAARRLSPHILASFLFLGAAGTFITWVVRDTIPAATLSLLPGLPLTGYAIVAGTILFVPTTIFLGAVSPYVVRLAISTLDSAASLIGNFSAIAAAGSIAGAVLAGMVLIPSFSLSAIILGLAVAIGGLALVASGAPLSRGLGAGALLFALAWYAHGSWTWLPPRVLADVDTPYSRVWISEIRDETRNVGVHYLQTDPFGTQCEMLFDANGPREDILAFSYLRAFAVADNLVETNRTLLLGGCNYSFPRFFLKEHPNASMDVVEIDPGMTAIAREWFGFRDDTRLTIIHDDARTALPRLTKTYDAVYMDTYNSFSSIPFHLTTQEFFASVSKVVDEDGLLIANVIGALTGDYAEFVASLYRTMRDVFPSVAVYTIGDRGDADLQNMLFVAAKADEKSFPSRLEGYGETLSLFAANDRNALATRGILLTDDYAPVESLTRPLREAATAP